MLSKTPQEWADFLGVKVVCLSIGTNMYEYRAIEYPYLPFSSAWLEYLPATLEYSNPEDFYKKYRWLLTKTLAKNKYDTIFIPTNIGDVNCLETKDDGHKYVVGRVSTISESSSLLPITTKKWDKTVYVPSYYEEDTDEVDGSEDVESTEGQVVV